MRPNPDLQTYLKEADESVFVCIMCETTEMMENIDEIVAVPGLDSICIGQMDWSGSLGAPYLTDWSLLQANPKAKAAVEKVCAACLKAGVAVGCSTGDMETATQIMKLVEGHGWINMGGDGAGATVARGSPSFVVS